MVAKYAHIDFLLILQPIENCETVIVYAYVFKNLLFFSGFLHRKLFEFLLFSIKLFKA